MLMKKGRRLIVMIAGLMIMSSSSLPWLNSIMPVNTSFGELLSGFLASISGGAVIVNLAALNQISMAAVLFAIGIITLVGSVLGSKPIALIGALCSVLSLAMWFMGNNTDFITVFTDFFHLGLGTQLLAGGALLTVIAVLMPRIFHRKPAV